MSQLRSHAKRSALTLAVVAVNLLAFAEWWFPGGALRAGDASGVYGTLYSVTGALAFPMLAVVLAVDVGSLGWTKFLRLQSQVMRTSVGRPRRIQCSMYHPK